MGKGRRARDGEGRSAGSARVDTTPGREGDSRVTFAGVDLGVLGARVSGARWVTARASYRESMFPIRVDARVVDLPARPRRRRRVTRERTHPGWFTCGFIGAQRVSVFRPHADSVTIHSKRFHFLCRICPQTARAGAPLPRASVNPDVSSSTRPRSHAQRAPSRTRCTDGTQRARADVSREL